MRRERDRDRYREPPKQRAVSMQEASFQTAQEAIRAWQEARTDAPGTERSGNFGNQPAIEWNTGAGLTVASDTAADVVAMNIETDTFEGNRALARYVGNRKRRRVEALQDERNSIKRVQFIGKKQSSYSTPSLTENLNRKIVRESLESSILMMLRRPVARRTEARGNRWIETLVNSSINIEPSVFIDVLEGTTVGPILNAEFEGSKIIIKAILIKLKFYPGGVVAQDTVTAFVAPIRVRIYQTSLRGFARPTMTSGLGLPYIAGEEQEFYSLLDQRSLNIYMSQPKQGQTGATKIRTLELYVNKGLRPVEVDTSTGNTDYTPTAGNLTIKITRDPFAMPGSVPVPITIKGWVKTFYQCEEIYRN